MCHASVTQQLPTLVSRMRCSWHHCNQAHVKRYGVAEIHATRLALAAAATEHVRVCVVPLLCTSGCVLGPPPLTVKSKQLSTTDPTKSRVEHMPPLCAVSSHLSVPRVSAT